MKAEGALGFFARDHVEDEPRGEFPGIYEGIVTKVVGASLWFVIPEFSRVHAFGPAHYPRPPLRTGAESGGSGDASFSEHSHLLRDPATPPKDTKVIVAFVNDDPHRPEVLKLKGWP